MVRRQDLSELYLRLKTLGPWLIVPVVALVAGWAIWLNFSAAAAASEEPVPPALSDEEYAAVMEEMELPEFDPQSAGAIGRAIELDTELPTRARIDVLRYTVQTGDSVFGIASQFQLEPETILWGNFETINDDPHLLRPGQELNILPVDGTYYQWQENDDLPAIATLFGVEVVEILEWPGNDLDIIDPQPQVGDWYVVPSGRRAFKQWLVPTIARGQAGVGSAYGPGGCSGEYSGSIGTGGFIWPTSNHTVSGNDYWSGHLAIDLAAGTGAPVYAADSGVVVFAGWSTVGYGNMVMLDHGNGWQTLYGHLNDATVTCGQSVGQGQNIGIAGSTGNSTGPHLHFEVRFDGGFINPWYVLP